MAIKRVNIYDAKSSLSKLIADLEKKGTTIVICRHGKPVADLVAHRSKPQSLRQHPKLKGAKFHSDPCQGVSESDWPEILR